MPRTVSHFSGRISSSVEYSGVMKSWCSSAPVLGLAQRSFTTPSPTVL
jgi:hypothetical protein